MDGGPPRFMPPPLPVQQPIFPDAKPPPPVEPQPFQFKLNLLKPQDNEGAKEVSLLFLTLWPAMQHG